MRLTKDHICEIIGNGEYWFDLNRMVFKSELLTMDKASLIYLICISFEKMYTIDNRKRALNNEMQRRFVYVSHIIESDILKVKVGVESFSPEIEILSPKPRVTAFYKTTLLGKRRK